MLYWTNNSQRVLNRFGLFKHYKPDLSGVVVAQEGDDFAVLPLTEANQKVVHDLLENQGFEDASSKEFDSNTALTSCGFDFDESHGEFVPMKRLRISSGDDNDDEFDNRCVVFPAVFLPHFGFQDFDKRSAQKLRIADVLREHKNKPQRSLEAQGAEQKGVVFGGVSAEFLKKVRDVTNGKMLVERVSLDGGAQAIVVNAGNADVVEALIDVAVRYEGGMGKLLQDLQDVEEVSHSSSDLD